MGWDFGGGIERLIQGPWGNLANQEGRKENGATLLSQEMYTMLASQSPITTDSPVTMKQSSSDVPALTISNDIGGSSVNIQGGSFSFGGGGDFNINVGGTTLTEGDVTIGGNTINFTPSSLPDGLVVTDPTTGTTQPLTTYIQDQIGGAGGGVMGQVTGGSGSSYTVSLYGNGLGAGPTATVTATVPQILGSETVPSGTYVLVATAGNEYSFQPPVWL